MDKANNENIAHSLAAFMGEFRVTEHLKFDVAAVQVGIKTIFQEHIRKHEIQTQRSAPRRPNENPYEGSIRVVKRKCY